MKREDSLVGRERGNLMIDLMKEIMPEENIFYENDKGVLILDDTFEAMRKMKDESVDMIFADPPYFLSNDGISCQGGRMVSVNKGDWDKETETVDKHQFNLAWIKECYRILKPSGTIWISGTFHNIYSVGMALEENNFKIINNITWRKTNPPPNLACKCFTHSTETVIWAKKDLKKAKPIFNYALMKELNGGKQMKDVWESPLTPPKEKKFGKHPTQKPMFLLNRIVEASTNEGCVVLDPFVGSGTTALSAYIHNCYFIGIDNNAEYLEIAKARLEAEK